MKFGEYELNTIIVPIVGTNCYLLSLNNNAILVDAAGDGKYIYDYIMNKHFDITTIFITHGHYDHIEALDFLLEKYPNVKIYANENEKAVIENIDYNLMENSLKETTKKAINYLQDGDIVKVLDLDIKIITTSGHTIGSSCFYIKDLNIMFSGDTLFRETYGRTDLPTGDAKSIAYSVAVKLMEYNDDLLVLPGHGFRTTIGYERTHNDIVINQI